MLLKCPICGAPVKRISRTSLDRLVSIIFPRLRYTCMSQSCDWEGIISKRGQVQGEVFWVVMLALSASLILFALFSFLGLNNGGKFKSVYTGEPQSLLATIRPSMPNQYGKY